MDVQSKAFVYSTIFHTIKEVNVLDKRISFSVDCLPEYAKSVFDAYADVISKEDSRGPVFAIINNDKLSAICDFFGTESIHTFDPNKMDISHILRRDPKECAEFIKCYFEKYGDFIYDEESLSYTCSITAYSRNHVDAIKDYLGIPCQYSKVHSLEQITFSGVNVVDFLGSIYTNGLYTKQDKYDTFLKIVRDRPVLRFAMDSCAIVPTKANYSDVGFDLSIVGMQKELTARTKLYGTGIRLDIPVGYYVEIVPRSSISKSGYLLANSVGIIDCSYKGELLVALTKIDDSMPDIVFPYRCCQLIMKRQVFPELMETAWIDKSKRAEGGFGSSG